MIIVGHPWVKSPKFHKVFTTDDIKKSKAEDVVLLEPLVDSHTQANYCHENKIVFAIVVSTLKEAIFANSLGAKYIICENNDALNIQPIAQEYLFDTRILVLINHEKEINQIARGGIDGVIFSEAIY